MVFQVLVYLFLLGSRGYFAHGELLNKKKTLQDQIAHLESEKENLLNRKNILKDDKKAKDRFQQELYLYDRKANTEIVKFELESRPFIGASSNNYTLAFWQNIYLIAGGVIQFLIVAFFYYRNKKTGNQHIL